MDVLDNHHDRRHQNLDHVHLLLASQTEQGIEQDVQIAAKRGQKMGLPWPCLMQAFRIQEGLCCRIHGVSFGGVAGLPGCSRRFEGLRFSSEQNGNSQSSKNDRTHNFHVGF